MLFRKASPISGYRAPKMPDAAERRPETPDETRAIDRAAIERLLTRRDVPLREKTLWRMLYETALEEHRNEKSR